MCRNVIWYRAVAHSISKKFMEQSALQMKTDKATTTTRWLDITRWLGYVKIFLFIISNMEIENIFEEHVFFERHLSYLQKTFCKTTRIMTNLLNDTTLLLFSKVYRMLNSCMLRGEGKLCLKS